MARTKSNAQKPNKSAFIRANSALKPAEIVKKGKEAGLDFSVEYVYSIRQNAKKAKLQSGSKASAPAAAARGRAASHSTSGGSSENTFRRLVIELGVGRARALVSEVENRLAQLVRGI